MNVRMKWIVVYVVVFLSLFVYWFGLPVSPQGVTPVFAGARGEEPAGAARLAAPIAVIPTGGPAHLVSEDNWVALRDAACADQIVRFYVPSGTHVIVLMSQLACNGKHWYLVEFADGSQGWLSAEEVRYDGP